ncbi:NIPSNAP family protein [Massilia terrae]|uniref:NIPSNAP family protein n=1 Tax=Massilia terrae TaxID=1811224 RepID=A0ABT2D0P9_9BURK|nr:NIPSNAP family protein [Massilia terrae]MCS0659814.1 NIPSNAP family protein [Massilia terrae]
MKTLFLSLALLGSLATAAPAPGDQYTVIELRRYQVKPERRADFVTYFDTLFPEAFQQLGALALGQFTEPDVPDRYTWLRAFHDLDARAIVNGSFYYGPVWKEHRQQLNDLIIDNDDVLLLRPLDAAHAVPVLAAVDPVREAAGTHGIVVAQLFPVKPGSVERFTKLAAPAFDAYRAAGARDAGVLVTLDVKNNFPQLPVRSDGPFVVWLGILPDREDADNTLRPIAARAAASLAEGDLLRGQPQLLVLKPTPRSRLRWLDGKTAR